MQGNDALFGSLADTAYRAGLEVEVTQVQPDQFAHTKPGGVKDFEHRCVPYALRGVVFVDGGEQGIYLLD